VFQVVKFPNDVCAGSTNNGTCYTSEECSSKGGKNEGSCASGFGICCTFTLSCGGSSSENNTYIVQASTTSFSTIPCAYTICPSTTNICRIRYDFTTFVLTSQVQGFIGGDLDTALVASQLNNGDLIGDCVDDQFSIQAGNGGGSPIICGTNTGYHMIIDADRTGSTCQIANFDIGGTATARSWNIHVRQYACGQEDEAGPPGCLQYYTQTSNSIQSFGWSATTVTARTTHLSSQKYDICIRRALGSCFICYTPKLLSAATACADNTKGDPQTQQKSFGLSVSHIAGMVTGKLSEMCSEDYLEIPGAQNAAGAAIAAVPNDADAANAPTVSRVCGRVLGVAAGSLTCDTATLNTVCSRATPFRVGVNFDDNELDGGTAAADKADVNEQAAGPGGIVGFQLTYWQVSCT